MKKAWIISFVILQAGILVGLTIKEKFFIYDLIGIFAAIQALQIAFAYAASKRTGPYEVSLVDNRFPIDLKYLVKTIPIQVVFLVLLMLLLKRLDKSILFYLVPIIVASSIIQYIIIKGKRIASFFIDGNFLFVNELFLRKYNLQDLQSVNFNGFNEIYTLEFIGSKKIKLKQENFDEKEFNSFLAVMCKKSVHEIIVSENIAGEIKSVAKTYIATNN